ncbi:ABC transporter ATP-binding protein [Streptomyces sp. AJS327]|uniref:ABC transporter ATP-binding protein n=1 Tax=Streptomyces sp. AJS327 TaxID=2545265 RepID=UPI0015DFFEE3|nr:ABC transporter ATP-binding protein [Streptomyces sp. AJS327]MBA0051657.1 ABC transporter ATP-binding protein [Streptomyces sp. AJS327]
MTPTAPPEPATAPALQQGPAHSSVRSLLRLWPWVRPVRARLFTAAFVAILASCTGLVVPLVLKWLVDGPVADRDTAGVWLGGALLLAVGFVEAGLFGLRRWLVARPLSRVEAGLRESLFHHLQRLPVAFHDRWASGQLLSRATTDLQLLRLFLAFPLTFLVVNGTTIAVGCVILLVQEWTLGLVLLAPVLPLLVFCSVFEARYAVESRRAQDQIGDLTTVVEESVLGIRVIKGFGRHRSQARAFRALSERLLSTELYKARLLAMVWLMITVLPELAIGAALVLGSVQVADGALSAGTLIAFLSTALALRWPVDSIGFMLAMCHEAATASDRYFEVLDEPVPPSVRTPVAGPELPEARRPDGAAPASRRPDGAGGGEPGNGAPGVAGEAARAAPGEAPVDGGLPARDLLCFEDVTFRYPDAPPDAPPVLDGVTLRVRAGETLALVGATGSGKTTLTALVPRLHEATGGRILLDGTDIATIPLPRLRERLAVAFEEATLFSASVRENVLMGAEPSGPVPEPDGEAPRPGPPDPLPDAGPDTPDANAPLRRPPGAADEPEAEDRARRALEVAQAGHFVGALPDGAATQVGEQGLSLSGGQRQRLALARAVVGDPGVLVLDDPLSALDVRTEAAVEAALRELLSGTTALVVAHRPSTVLLADRVALLSGGRIAALGTHHELLADSAEYRHLMSGEATGGTA